MIQPKMTISFAGGLILGALLILALAAQEPEAKPDPTQQEMLKALIASQERQAAAWEKLAEKGWPTPQNLTLAGDVPSFLAVDLSGALKLSGEIKVGQDTLSTRYGWKTHEQKEQ